ncbi:predicted protein [Arabidopsis lyrata subsp. lyrata]|uniref:Predicted protein n=1 Tax=Arabidopsis lyrata subsp. lyrata TaxID=81972 RepID=D7MWK9_ARALL|nr:predicted protein [Arabidopsis lyrata subsp. lyrata]
MVTNALGERLWTAENSETTKIWIYSGTTLFYQPEGRKRLPMRQEREKGRQIHCYAPSQSLASHRIYIETSPLGWWTLKSRPREERELAHL